MFLAISQNSGAILKYNFPDRALLHCDGLVFPYGDVSVAFCCPLSSELLWCILSDPAVVDDSGPDTSLVRWRIAWRVHYNYWSVTHVACHFSLAADNSLSFMAVRLGVEECHSLLQIYDVFWDSDPNRLQCYTLFSFLSHQHTDWVLNECPKFVIAFVRLDSKSACVLDDLMSDN